MGLELNKTNTHQNNNFGFSLIETIVSVFILSIFISSIFGVIFYVNKTQKNIELSVSVNSDINNIFNKIISDIRSSDINYEYYKSAGNYAIDTPENSLALINNSFNVVYKKNNNCFGLNSCLQASFNNGVNFQNLTTSNINIERFNVYISPKSDTFRPRPSTPTDCKFSSSFSRPDRCRCNNTLDCFTDQTCTSNTCTNPKRMPLVTIVMSGYSEDKLKNKFYFNYQNTIEIRKYLR